MLLTIESFWFERPYLYVEMLNSTFKIPEWKLVKILKNRGFILDYSLSRDVVYVTINMIREVDEYTYPVNVNLEAFILDELTKEDVELVLRDKMGI